MQHKKEKFHLILTNDFYPKNFPSTHGLMENIL